MLYSDHESQMAHLFKRASRDGKDALILATSFACLSSQSSFPTLCVSCPNCSFGSFTDILNFGISIHWISSMLYYCY